MSALIQHQITSSAFIAGVANAGLFKVNCLCTLCGLAAAGARAGIDFAQDKCLAIRMVCFIHWYFQAEPGTPRVLLARKGAMAALRSPGLV